MFVSSSEIGMKSTHEETNMKSIQESLSFKDAAAPDLVRLNNTDRLDISSGSQPLSQEHEKSGILIEKSGSTSEEDDFDCSLNPDLRILLFILEKFFGKKLDFLSPKDYEKIKRRIEQNNSQNQREINLHYSRSELSYESEKTEFSAAGTVKTADGKELSFSLSLKMSREFLQENNFVLDIGSKQKKDPLVINFDGTAAELSGKNFSFDIDSDGNSEILSCLNAGSGFLAFDKNNDGKINDGSELFGTKSGNGLSELSGYDSDGNGWLDEADPFYNSLRIWVKNNSGEDSIYNLKQKNIGAIYLKSIFTPFQLNSGTNNKLGEIGSTGLFLKENGTPGTVQQMNYLV